MNKSQQNPLIPDILCALKRNLAKDSPAAFGIHHLLTELSGHPCFEGLADSNELGLFKKNFMMMNALYQLQQSLWQEEQLQLNIEPLNVHLAPRAPQSTGNSALSSADPMQEYYLDWRHYFETTQEDVEALLNQFWQRCDGGDKKTRALECLGLGVEAGVEEIKLRYQQLASQHHPDKGGDTARFIAIREAYEILRS